MKISERFETKIIQTLAFSYIIMENLRHLLYQHRPQTSLFFGHRQIYKYSKLFEGYMSGEKKRQNPLNYFNLEVLGAGYILSRKALEKLAKTLRTYPKKFFYPDNEREDVEMGAALENSAIFVDGRDDKLQRLFLPFSPVSFILGKVPRWYSEMSYYESPLGSMNCCSDIPIAFHYVNGSKQYLNEYLVYRVQPFGLHKNTMETLPNKKSLEEIIKASDGKSVSKFFRAHNDLHEIEPSERLIK